MADSHARTAFTERIMGKSLYTKACWVTASRPVVHRVYKYEIHKLGTEHNPKSLFFLNNVSGVVLVFVGPLNSFECAV